MRRIPMRKPGVAAGGRIDRRTFFRRAFVASFGVAPLLEACARPVSTPQASTASGQPGPTGSTPTSAPASIPASGLSRTASSSVQAILPTYIPSPTVKPDLPPSDAGLQAGYLTYPNDQVQTVLRTPGLGGDVTALSSLNGAPSPPVDQNPAWQAINKQMNANMRLLQVAQSDYMARAATIMAGSDLPDLFALTPNTLGIARLPQFLKSSYADLTPYL